MRPVPTGKVAPGKALLALLLVLLMAAPAAQAQWHKLKYDRRRFSLGFLMGANVSFVRKTYGPKNYVFDGDTLHVDYIDVTPTPGVTLGLITSVKLHDMFDLRFIPAVSLMQRNFKYYFKDGTRVDRSLESAYMELPLMIKWKSQFYQNHRVYLMFGAKLSVNLMSDQRTADDPDLIKIQKVDGSIEAAFGIDLYGDRVKLSPEIRYSLGVPALYSPEKLPTGPALTTFQSHSIMLLLNFE